MWVTGSTDDGITRAQINFYIIKRENQSITYSVFAVPCKTFYCKSEPMPYSYLANFLITLNFQKTAYTSLGFLSEMLHYTRVQMQIKFLLLSSISHVIHFCIALRQICTASSEIKKKKHWRQNTVAASTYKYNVQGGGLWKATLHPKDTTTASNTLSSIPWGSLFIASVYRSWRSEKERKQNPRQRVEQLYSGQLASGAGRLYVVLYCGVTQVKE